MYKDYIEKLADRIIRKTDTEYHMNMEAFDWVPGVALIGLYAAYKETGKQQYLDFLTDWFGRWLQEAPNKKTVNSSAPLLTALKLYEESGDRELLKVCRDVADWTLTQAPITRDGGLEHTVIEDVDGFSEQIWGDTVFMCCIFLAKLGKLTGENKYSHFAAKQLAVHYEVLQDRESGLCYHGWNCAAKNHLSGAYWGRANAWMLCGGAEILRLTDKCDGNIQARNSLQQHVAALAKVQREDGMFGTLLNDPTSYSEASATAGIAAGIRNAVAAGIVDDKYTAIFERAEKRLLDFVETDGTVGNVSGGTPIMPTLQSYKEIPLRPTLYGQGLALLTLSHTFIL